MKRTIEITGQISGNFTLARMIGCEAKRGMFSSFTIPFATKKEAVKAIRDAYNSLVAEEPELKGCFGGIRVNKDRTELYYDASKAIIL